MGRDRKKALLCFPDNCPCVTLGEAEEQVLCPAGAATVSLRQALMGSQRLRETGQRRLCTDCHTGERTMKRPRWNQTDDYAGPRITRATVSPADNPAKVVELEIGSVRGGSIMFDGLPIGPWLLMTPGTRQVSDEWSTLGLRRHGGIEEEEYDAIRNCGGSKEDKRLLVLALVSQVAAESMVNDWKAADALRKWARAKFASQGAAKKFDSYWGVIEQVADRYQKGLHTRPFYYREGCAFTLFSQ